MPIYAVIAHTKTTKANQQKGVSCGTVCVAKINHFDSTTYGKTNIATRIAEIECHTKITIYATSAITQCQRSPLLHVCIVET